MIKWPHLYSVSYRHGIVARVEGLRWVVRQRRRVIGKAWTKRGADKLARRAGG